MIILSLKFLRILRTTKEILQFRLTLAYSLYKYIYLFIFKLKVNEKEGCALVSQIKVREDSDRMLPDALNHIIKAVRPFLESPFESCRALAISLRQTPRCHLLPAAA